MSVELIVSILLAVSAASFILYPLFFRGSERQTVPVDRHLSHRRGALLDEVEEEFTTGKISQESYDHAVREIKDLTGE